MHKEHMRLGTSPRLSSLKPYASCDRRSKNFLQGSDFFTTSDEGTAYSGLTKNLADHQIASREALLKCFRSDAHKEGVACLPTSRNRTQKRLTLRATS